MYENGRGADLGPDQFYNGYCQLLCHFNDKSVLILFGALEHEIIYPLELI
jgi:hypothetical protein